MMNTEYISIYIKKLSFSSFNENHVNAQGSHLLLYFAVNEEAKKKELSFKMKL